MVDIWGEDQVGAVFVPRQSKSSSAMVNRATGGGMNAGSYCGHMVHDDAGVG